MIIFDLFKEDMKFSAGHFTIFSATERENLHGHNYHVHAQISATVDDNGLSFNYQEAKQHIRALCDSLDEIMLLPTHSPHLRISEPSNEEVQVVFHNETLRFLPRDVKCLPVRNITVEELSSWFLNALLKTSLCEKNTCIKRIVIKILSGSGQSGASEWSR